MTGLTILMIAANFDRESKIEIPGLIMKDFRSGLFSLVDFQNTMVFIRLRRIPRLLAVDECGLKAVALRRIAPGDLRSRITPKHTQKISEKCSSVYARGNLERDHRLARGAPYSKNWMPYRKAVDFADKICELTKDPAKGNYYLAEQLNRSSLSISTNIAEGNGRFRNADRSDFLRIARGSAFECVPILEICGHKQLVDEAVNISLKKRNRRYLQDAVRLDEYEICLNLKWFEL